jgi:cobalt-zinc-cadmium resistance protein CzcA
MEQVAGQPYLNIGIDRRKIARHGINVADIQEIIETAVGGKAATQILEGNLRVDVLVRFPEERRNSIEAIGNILVETLGGDKVPLANLATIVEADGPVQISRENAQRRIVVEFNVQGRDTGGLVAEAQGLLESRLGLPPGYYLTWGGAFENQQRALRYLMIIVPVTVAIIFLLLVMSFNSLRYAALIILNLPLALIGGILGLFITGLYLSVPASVGFIALFGVAVLNGVVLISQINQLRQEGLPLEEAVPLGCERRLRPVLIVIRHRAGIGGATAPGRSGGLRPVLFHPVDSVFSARALRRLRRAVTGDLAGGP